jgi:hypothetical protein
MNNEQTDCQCDHIRLGTILVGLIALALIVPTAPWWAYIVFAVLLA